MQESKLMMETLKVKLDEGAYLPERAHDTDAGADLRTRKLVKVNPGCQMNVHTGVHVELPPYTVGMIKSKSGLYIKNGITVTGVIDEGFTGEIIVGVRNNGDKPVTFQPGMKIAQLVVLPVVYTDFEAVDEIGGGERGDSGYGSTGLF